MILFSGNYIWILLPMTHQVTFLRKFSKDKNLLEKAGLSIRKAEAHWRGSISQSQQSLCLDLLWFSLRICLNAEEKSLPISFYLVLSSEDDN